MQTVMNGKDAVIVEENPNYRTVEVIPLPEPTITEQKMPSMGDGSSTIEVIPSGEPTIVERVNV